MEIALEIMNELAQSETFMWVVGPGPVVSENHSKGIKKPQRHNDTVTIEADNWHCHINIPDITGIQFVETKSHGDRLSYYVRFSGAGETTLLRGYFPNPYMDQNLNPTPLQPEKLKAFTDLRDKYVGRDGIVFVHYVPPSRT